MQLTTKGRYAVTAMLDLASNDSSRPVTLDMISQRQNDTLPTDFESQNDSLGGFGLV